MKKLMFGLFVLCIASGQGFAADGAGLQVDKLVQSTRSWDDSTLPGYPQGQPEITILRITIPPGARLPMHEHPVINAGVLLSGELTVVSEGGKTLHLKAGEPIVELVGSWHYGENPGDQPAEIIVFYVGDQGAPITIKKEQSP